MTKPNVVFASPSPPLSLCLWLVEPSGVKSTKATEEILKRAEKAMEVFESS
jgi:hypothetical protein